jgi:hypothetical protein
MRKTQKVAIVGGTVATLMAGGIAYAAWTSEGSGTGTATAGSAVTLGVDGNDISGLYPTGTFAATVKVTNPNPYKVTLSSLDFTGATTTAAGCDASTVTVADLTGLSEELGANGGDHTFAVEVSMSNDATDECQGATFELNYTAHGASS